MSNISIFLRCLLYRIIYSLSFRQSAKSTETVAVVQLAQMGDMVCTTPLLKALKKNGKRVILVGRSLYEELIAGNQDVDLYMGHDDDFEATVKKLRSEKIDIGLLATPSFKGLALLCLGGSKNIVAPRVVGGFSPQQTLLYRLLKKLFISRRYHFGRYVPREMLKLLKPIGITSNDTEKKLYFSSSAEEKVEQLLSEKGIASADLVVGISPSSGNKIKNWGAEKFAWLADYLADNYKAKIVVIGTKNDLTETAEMLKNIKSSVNMLNTVGHLNLDELKALVARLDVFISVDSGPIYVAEAFNIPTIDIVGPVDEREQPPMGPTHRIVKWEDRIAPALHILNARVYDFKEARRQVEMISVDLVVREFDQLFKYIKNKPLEINF